MATATSQRATSASEAELVQGHLIQGPDAALPKSERTAPQPPLSTPSFFVLERLATPLGQLLLATDEQARLRAVDWQDHEESMHRLLRRQYAGTAIELRETSTISPARRAMQAYFDGEIDAIDTLEVATGGTEFQRAVWTALRTIPGGETLSYRELALRLGRASATRAVGLANGANPVSIVVPCHRVIGSNSTLTGYGGGLPRKQWLLDHERRWWVAQHPSAPGASVQLTLGLA
ncbi:MAG: methylated-DNA--[protein]-cysteine S-methyltransferase [Pigmentiphaga sp.]|nr:methylated-DNA--[protein]-cysteine S-methyltransferase [Pigmentiphaga sp.]